MSAELAVIPTSQAMAERPSSGLALSFAEMTMRVAQLDQFYREVMQDGTDYGKIPGTDKPTLYQPGAQMLDQIFGYVPTFEVTPSSRIDWDRPIPFFHYIVVCRLVSRRTGETVAEGIGSCNSQEDKYRWRNAKPACPECARELFRSKQKPEWFCWRSKGGCGATVALDAVGSGGKVENEDTASLENTISKMAQKRAHIAATLNATGASRIFTQDIEDLPQFQQARTVVAEVMDAPPERPDDSPKDSEARKPRPPAPTPSRAVATPVDPTPQEEERARAMVGEVVSEQQDDAAVKAALRVRAVRRYKQLSRIATDRKHDVAAKANAAYPERLTAAALAGSVIKLEELFPNVPELTDEQAREFGI
jgi:hypothetical protein